MRHSGTSARQFTGGSIARAVPQKTVSDGRPRIMRDGRNGVPSIRSPRQMTERGRI